MHTGTCCTNYIDIWHFFHASSYLAKYHTKTSRKRTRCWDPTMRCISDCMLSCNCLQFFNHMLEFTLRETLFVDALDLKSLYTGSMQRLFFAFWIFIFVVIEHMTFDLGSFDIPIKQQQQQLYWFSKNYSLCDFWNSKNVETNFSEADDKIVHLFMGLMRNVAVAAYRCTSSQSTMHIEQAHITWPLCLIDKINHYANYYWTHSW